MKYDGNISPEAVLIQAIRGYSGYQKTETRQKTDKQLREYLSSEIKHIEKSFLKLSNRVEKQGYASIAQTINRLNKQIKSLIDTLNKPSYHNSPFFNYSRVTDDTLSQLYEYESQLKHQVDILNDEVSELEKIEEISETDAYLSHIFDVIDNLNQIIMEREFLLAG